ncbi:MAG: hypothetical protein ACOX3R_10445 [Desulfitobacteriia bacterium]|jgi:hypothetical protein
MGKHKKNAKAKSSLTVRDPIYSEYDQQKERNVQELNRKGKPSDR